MEHIFESSFYIDQKEVYVPFPFSLNHMFFWFYERERWHKCTQLNIDIGLTFTDTTDMPNN